MNARKNFTPSTGKTRFPIPSTLAVAVTVAVLSGVTIPVQAATAERDNSTIVVEAKDAEAAQGLVAGGMSARASSTGLLGKKDVMDTPFNVSNMTSSFIENKQAQTLGQVVAHDASVRVSSSQGGLLDSYYIRGFPLNEGNLSDIAMNGVYGVAPNYQLMTDYIERVEVLKGPSALLYGLSPNSSVGGVINAVTKRPTTVGNLTRLTTSWQSDSQFTQHADISRVYALDNNNLLGVRFNGNYGYGDTVWDGSDKRTQVGSLGLDFSSERFRATLDLITQHLKTRAPSRPYSFAAGVTVPDAPDGNNNISQPWGFWHSKDQSVLLHTEYDLADNITWFTDLGGSSAHVSRLSEQVPQVTNNNGDIRSGVGNYRFTTSRYNFATGVRADVETGSVTHKLSAQTSYYRDRQASASRAGTAIDSNIYNPVYVPAQDIAAPSSIYKRSSTALSGIALADTLGFWNDVLQVTGGLRYQQINSDNFSAPDGGTRSSYDKSAITPMLGVIVKPWQHVSLYANYIEGLSKGDVAPMTASNAGQVLTPYKSKQYEAGVKMDALGTISTLSVFQITKPSGALVNGTFVEANEQRNRGIELDVVGSPLEDLRLTGGVMLLDAELTKSVTPGAQGKRAPGTSRFQANAGVEYDLPFLRDLTLNANVIHNGKQNVNTINTQSIPSWTTVDFGARYKTRIYNAPTTFRADVLNAFDRNYWSGVTSFSTVSQGTPRTLMLSVAVDF
ncbi:TonB-dependent siderophore receptor [Pectobacterium parmentieri]|uniref:TonB-dependent receptor n=1 Tax=Pectobacterium parmentieri TaxID=1905730 RepID=UPI0001B10811|nr:TonB-dependent siderophore receptor [Pectobacterium parmentieri]ACX89807.1 TonB-dependent siderophore receptor [Pectobacterium parmentieri WPP163]AYH03189.1 TonB-dependent siderophore receptor [Pectobacterium parmentieri]AYH29448.1 TonB-dependent siderophore receptor [Pectobacterium parmentieri]AYH33866.1 TonB-dependent siderophore receptor [Pectobacterium parmentieri]MBI0517129.1 TonB-dependent siderophore receptor [Pectobacterium parmentieri]